MNWNRFVAYLLTILLVWPPNLLSAATGNALDQLSDAANQAGAQSSASLEERLAGLDTMARFSAEYASHLNRKTFDFDENLDALGYDLTNIIDFAKSSIAFEQYPGVLRGPIGTLLGRSGNSIDQSLLLGKLLRDAGYDARIVGARLSEGEARLLLREMARPKHEELVQADIDGLMAVIMKYKSNAEMGDDQRDLIAKTVARSSAKDFPDKHKLVEETSAFLLQKLASNDIKLDASSADDRLIDEARDYYWVQYRDAISDPWKDAHPAFASTLPFDQPAPQSTIANEIPEEMQHRFRFQIFLEQKVGGSLRVKALSSPWERPVANLVGVPLAFLNMPDSALGENAGSLDVQGKIDPSTVFMPVFNTGLPEGGQYFDLQGNLIDAMVAGDQAAGIVKQVGRAFTEATGEIGGAENIPTLTAQWLEFTFIDPNGKEHSYRRMIFDRIGAAQRESGQVPKSLGPVTTEEAQLLAQRATFMIHVSKIPKAFAMARGADYFSKTVPLIKQETRRLAGEKIKEQTTPDFTPQWVGHYSLLSLFDLADTIGNEHRVYRPAPGLIMHLSGVTADGGIRESVDIVTNPVRAVNLGAGETFLDPIPAMKAGLWETAIEGQLLQGDDTGHDTWTAFKLAQESGVAIQVLTASSALDDAQLSPDTVAAINWDLERGYVVVVPTSESAPGTSGWWRIDPQTGETLGQYGDGRGAAATEYSIMQIAAKVMTYGCLALGVSSCVKTSGSYGSFLCCAGINFSFFLLGMAYISWSVTSIAYDFVTFVGPFTDVCSAFEK